jgi:hypothetical protein
MNNNTLRGLSPRSQYAEIKRRAAKRLANRAAAPSNWSKLTNAQVAELIKHNIGAWRATAYMKGIQRRTGLVPALGTAENRPRGNFYKGKNVAMYEGMGTRPGRGPYARSLLLTSTNVYRKSGGVRTAAAKGLRAFGPTHMGGRINNLKNWFAGHVRRHLGKKVVRAPVVLERNADVMGLPNVRSVRVVRKSANNNWRLKNNKYTTKNYLVTFTSQGNHPELFIVPRKK